MLSWQGAAAGPGAAGLRRPRPARPGRRLAAPARPLAASIPRHDAAASLPATDRALLVAREGGAAGPGKRQAGRGRRHVRRRLRARPSRSATSSPGRVGRQRSRRCDRRLSAASAHRVSASPSGGRGTASDSARDLALARSATVAINARGDRLLAWPEGRRIAVRVRRAGAAWGRDRCARPAAARPRPPPVGGHRAERPHRHHVGARPLPRAASPFAAARAGACGVWSSAAVRRRSGRAALPVRAGRRLRAARSSSPGRIAPPRELRHGGARRRRRAGRPGRRLAPARRAARRRRGRPRRRSPSRGRPCCRATTRC